MTASQETVLGWGWREIRSYRDKVECRRGLAMRILSVCLSVRPSVCQTRALWQNGRKICPDFCTIRKIIQPSFLRRSMVVGGRPLLPEILGQPIPVGAKSPILNRYSLVAVLSKWKVHDMNADSWEMEIDPSLSIYRPILWMSTRSNLPMNGRTRPSGVIESLS